MNPHWNAPAQIILSNLTMVMLNQPVSNTENHKNGILSPYLLAIRTRKQKSQRFGKHASF